MLKERVEQMESEGPNENVNCQNIEQHPTDIL